jgi:hypothetical protein
VSHIRRLRLSDRIFFVTVNLHRRLHPLVMIVRSTCISMPVRKGLVSKPKEWRWSSYSNFTLNKALLADRPIQIDYVTLSQQYRG